MSTEVRQCFTVLVKCSMADVLNKPALDDCVISRYTKQFASVVLYVPGSAHYWATDHTTRLGYLPAKSRISSFTRFPCDHHDLIRVGENLPRDHQVGPSNAWRVSR
jgi:hypothetical protein